MIFTVVIRPLILFSHAANIVPLHHPPKHFSPGIAGGERLMFNIYF